MVDLYLMSYQYFKFGNSSFNCNLNFKYQKMITITYLWQYLKVLKAIKKELYIHPMVNLRTCLYTRE